MHITKKILTFVLFLLALPPAYAEEHRELKVACGSVGLELQLCQEAVATWSKKTGTPASVVSMPTATSERLALYQQFLSAKESSIDVFQVDVVWPGVLKNHLLDLTPYVPESEIQRHFPSTIAALKVDGKLMGLPLYTDVGVLHYRKDLLDKYHLSVPETWDELTRFARIIQDGERKAGDKDFWGFVWEGRANESLTCNAMEWLASSDGGTIVDDTGKVTIVNSNAAAALDRAASWVSTITPPGVLNYTEEEARGVFQSGKAAFMRNWPYAWGLAQNEGSPIKGKVEMSPLPSGKKGGKHVGTLGGWELAVSRYSLQPEKAADLVRYMTGPEVQKQYAIRGAYTPTIIALFQDPEVLKVMPQSQVLRKALDDAVARPSRITGLRYNQVSNGFWNAVHATLSKDGDAMVNLQSFEHRLHRISKGETWK